MSPHGLFPEAQEQLTQLRLRHLRESFLHPPCQAQPAQAQFFRRCQHAGKPWWPVSGRTALLSRPAVSQRFAPGTARESRPTKLSPGRLEEASHGEPINATVVYRIGEIRYGGYWRTMRPEEAYRELIRRSRDEALLASCADLLSWDELTYLPAGGVEHRGEQLAYLAGLLHDQATDPRVGDLLEEVEGTSELADADSAGANVREIRRAYQRQTRLPRRFVEEFARVTTVAQQA